MAIAKDQIGGGIVMRTFMNGERRMAKGTRLSVDDLASMRNADRLIHAGFIEAFPIPHFLAHPATVKRVREA